MRKTLLTAAALAIGLAGAANASPVQWKVSDGGNGHWYELIWPGIGEISWTYAKNAAEASTHNGQQGYLATITSAAEQAFLNALNAAFTAASPYHYGTYVQAWLGGNDLASEGTWAWNTGETWGPYTNWASGEPNNYNGSEDYLLGWWSGDKWNDCGRYCGVHKYVVEYDDKPSEVPVPASLPLALAGFGVMGWIGRRRKAA